MGIYGGFGKIGICVGMGICYEMENGGRVYVVEQEM